jgi:hypothetical protein
MILTKKSTFNRLRAKCACQNPLLAGLSTLKISA